VSDDAFILKLKSSSSSSSISSVDWVDVPIGMKGRFWKFSVKETSSASSLKMFSTSMLIFPSWPGVRVGVLTELMITADAMFIIRRSARVNETSVFLMKI